MDAIEKRDAATMELLRAANALLAATYATDASVQNRQFDQLSFAVYLAENIVREVEHFAQFTQASVK